MWINKIKVQIQFIIKSLSLHVFVNNLFTKTSYSTTVDKIILLTVVKLVIHTISTILRTSYFYFVFYSINRIFNNIIC